MVTDIFTAVFTCPLHGVCQGWEIVWRLMLCCALSAFVQAVTSHTEIRRLLSERPPWITEDRGGTWGGIFLVFVCG
jgi:hypothetical protein